MCRVWFWTFVVLLATSFYAAFVERTLEEGGQDLLRLQSQNLCRVKLDLFELMGERLLWKGIAYAALVLAVLALALSVRAVYRFAQGRWPRHATS